MLTLFSCPRAFTGHIGIIQVNAIHSWTLLKPKPEIILFGDDEGVKEISAKFGARHIAALNRNEFSTPLLNSFFYDAQAAASHSLMCYVNSDIILMNSLSRVIQAVSQQANQCPFLIIGQRWNVKVGTPWDFSNPEWEEQLRDYAKIYGKLDRVTGIDYFVFPKGLFGEIPPFVLGRCWHDAWLIYRAKKLKVPVIDATSQNMIIHQRHDFFYTAFNKKGILNMKSPEVANNQKLCRDRSRFYTVLDASHVLNYDGLKKPCLSRRVRKFSTWLTRYTWYVISEVCHPYSLPIVIAIRGLKSIISKLKELTGNKNLQ
jgi:hypothetical protein